MNKRIFFNNIGQGCFIDTPPGYENNIDLHIMGQKKGQTGNPNGRPKGSPNRVTGTVKEWIASIIDGNRQQFEEDLSKLDAGERVRVISNLLPFVVPKLQSASAQELLEAEYKKLEELLETAPDEAINEIVERINRLKNESRREATED